MAQSPEKNAGSSQILRYDLGWKAINDLLRQGRSLSGYERNCAFLNLGGENDSRFADASAALGLDFPDDGRVLALSDWDFDGDVDFWITNRSGPSVRYLRNDLAHSNNFLSFFLRGTKSNRDAIGARITIKTPDGRSQSRTLKAGEGYLSQSSKWLRFGLGSNEEITSLTVRWPNGSEQNFEPPSINRFHILVEDQASPHTWTPPKTKTLLPQTLKSPPVSDQARLVLLFPLPTPSLDELTSNIKKARLVTLWTSWCPNCLAELEEWSKHSDDFSKAGLEIIALNADEKDAQIKYQELGHPFPYRHASPDLVNQFDVLQRSLLSRQRPLPVPSSFLFDAKGQLRAVYKGPVSAAQLLTDCKLVEATPEQTLAASAPFPGLWNQPPGGTTPGQLATKLIEAGELKIAQSYLEKLIEDPAHINAPLLNLLGSIYHEKRQFSQAATTFLKSLQVDPWNRKAHMEVGTLALDAKAGFQAEPHFVELLKHAPNDPELIYKLGLAQLYQNKFTEARDTMNKALSFSNDALIHWQLAEIHMALRNPATTITAYEKALQIDPSFVSKANNLAWILATIDDDQLRNGKRALELALAIVESDSNANNLDTLAAAYAETGNFPKAIATLQEIPGPTEDVQDRLKLYRKNIAHRESP